MAKAYIKQKVLVASQLPATKEYRYIEPRSVCAFNAYEWDSEKGKKARARSVEVRRKKPKPKQEMKKPRPKPKPVEKKVRHRKWTFAQKEDIVQRHESGDNWATIAEDYGTTSESVRAVWSRWTGRK